MPVPWENWIQQIRDAGIQKAVIPNLIRIRNWNTAMPNEVFREIVETAPDLFIGFADVEPLDKLRRFNEKCLDDLDKAVNEYAMRAVKMGPQYEGYAPNDKALYPVYEKIVQLDVPIMFRQSWVRNMISSPASNSQILLLDEVLQNFPKLRICVAHLRSPWSEELFCLMGKAPPTEVYADISGDCLSRPYWLAWNLVMAKEYHVIDKVMFGTDGPGLAGSPSKWVSWCKNLINDIWERVGWPAPTEEEIDGILGKNAMKYLRL